MHPANLRQQSLSHHPSDARGLQAWSFVFDVDELSACITSPTSKMLAYETYQPGFDPSMTYGYTCHSYGHYPHSRHSSYSFPTYTAPHNIMILGATGTIGTYITRAIVDANSQGHFGRISIFTSEKTIVEKVQDICALESMGVEIFVGSLDDERRFKDACRGRCIRPHLKRSELTAAQELTR